jgi:hypothetical protein
VEKYVLQHLIDSKKEEKKIKDWQQMLRP